MKLSFSIASCLLLSGCLFDSSQDIQHAEKLLHKFNCQNIENAQIAHSAISSYHQQSLIAARQKAQSYITSYKNGEQLFDLSLSEMVIIQYQKYHSACQSLGGIPYPLNEMEHY